MNYLDLNYLYSQWHQSIEKMDDLIELLEKDCQGIQNEYHRKKFEQRINVITQNFNNQIDMVNAFQQMLNESIPAWKVKELKDKLDLAKLYINKTGGDWNSLAWLKKSDF